MPACDSHLDLFPAELEDALISQAAMNEATKRGHSYEIDLTTYDRVIVAFSGGKDSAACLFHLLELGVDRSKIELHHHLVDGEDQQEADGLMDWPCTNDYCRKVAEAFG